MGCKVLQQKNIKVYYESEEVGDYYADLLVDDLVTSGATAVACTLALNQAGARQVYVLTLARVG